MKLRTRKKLSYAMIPLMAVYVMSPQVIYAGEAAVKGGVQASADSSGNTKAAIPGLKESAAEAKAINEANEKNKR
ncbi:MAG: hypothetical protein WAW23_04875, partial [Candidatus Methanoperedens sp.]